MQSYKGKPWQNIKTIARRVVFIIFVVAVVDLLFEGTIKAPIVTRLYKVELKRDIKPGMTTVQIENWLSNRELEYSYRPIKVTDIQNISDVPIREDLHLNERHPLGELGGLTIAIARNLGGVYPCGHNLQFVFYFDKNNRLITYALHSTDVCV